MKTESVVLAKLAELFGTTVNNRRLEIPAQFGKGYCAGFIFNEHIRMFIMNYELHEDVIIPNPNMNISKRMLLFKFHDNKVLITTSSLHVDTEIPIHSNTATINIEVDADYLNNILTISDQSVVLQNLLQNTQPLLFEQMIAPALQNIADEIMKGWVDETFELFFLRIKAEEIICKLLMELEKRDEKQLYALNAKDVQAIYKIKDQLLAQLDIPPVIDTLSAMANMSPTKLKRLFKQIFGDSIFSYYQGFRIKEAARLLKEESLSVSDVGYQMGFTNMSHFARVFQEHMGVKPKQYSKGHQ